MKSLETIQKIIKVFKVITVIAMVASFIAALFLLVGVTLLNMIPESDIIDKIISAVDYDSPKHITGVLLSDFVLCLAEGILALFFLSYFKKELQDGTPFTQEGAEAVKGLGIKTIVLSFAAVIIGAILLECFEVGTLDYLSNGSSAFDYLSNGANFALGVGLLLLTPVLRYGAALEQKANSK